MSFQKIENNLRVIGDIDTTGLVDGRNVALDGSTLDIHVGATADVHGAIGFVVGTGNTYDLYFKTLIRPTIAEILNSGTLTLPSGPDYLLGRTSGDTLSNKSLVDASTYIVDQADPSISIRFNSSGSAGTSTTISTQQTTDRVLILPNASDQLVGRATSDTLTNKTLTNVSNFITATSLRTSGGAQVTVSTASAPTLGQVLYADSTTSAIWKTLTNITATTATVSTSTASSVDVVIQPISSTISVAGTYLLTFVSSCQLNKGNTGTVTIYNNGVAVDYSLVSYKSPDSNAITPIMSQAVITATASNPVSARFKTDGGTFTMYQRSMSIQRIY